MGFIADGLIFKGLICTFRFVIGYSAKLCGSKPLKIRPQATQRSDVVLKRPAKPEDLSRRAIQTQSPAFATSYAECRVMYSFPVSCYSNIANRA
jgi:hypothetical protein